MATAPFLLLIVAALPRAEAAPVVSAIAHEARAVASVVTRAIAAVDETDDVKAQLAIAQAPAVTKRVPKPKLIAALPTPPLEVEAPPVLAARVEPGEPRGPPA